MQAFLSLPKHSCTMLYIELEEGLDTRSASWGDGDRGQCDACSQGKHTLGSQSQKTTINALHPRNRHGTAWCNPAKSNKKQLKILKSLWRDMIGVKDLTIARHNDSNMEKAWSVWSVQRERGAEVLVGAVVLSTQHHSGSTAPVIATKHLVVLLKWSSPSLTQDSK